MRVMYRMMLIKHGKEPVVPCTIVPTAPLLEEEHRVQEMEDVLAW
jgi:hypothetical protein